MKSKISQLFVSSRPISWVNTSYPFAAACVVLNHTVNPQFIIGTVYFLIPYNVLMYGINDVFDYESDILNPRKGGVEGAKLNKESHRFVIVTSILLNLPFALYFLLQGSLISKVFFIYLIFMVVAYSAPKLRFKERPFLDSFTSSTHFAGPMVYGMLLTGWRPGLWPYIIAFFAWGMASHAYGAVQDIIPDKEAGIGSIATIIGASNTVRLSALAYASSFVVLAFQSLPAAIVGSCNLLYILSVAPYLNVVEKESEKANAGWKRFIKLNWFTGFVITIVIIVTKYHKIG